LQMMLRTPNSRASIHHSLLLTQSRQGAKNYNSN
jgi:hypothetical protein